MKNKKVKLIISIILAVCIIIGVIVGFKETGQVDKNEVDKAIDIIVDGINTYNMTETDIKELPSTEIVEQTEENEKEVGKEQEVESEGFELQGEIAYEGDRANTWNVELGDYKGLTYYSQIDNRWKNRIYSSIGDCSQTIGSSGCGPTSASMVVTATKGTITPDTMSELFVRYGYRSANQGTYWSAFRAVADEFNIGYTETNDVQRALQLLQNNNYVIASCGNGLFTTGGHFIVLVGVENGNIKIYDPYLYSGKFDTSTRRGKVTVDGNTVYCPINNFINYANAKGFFCYRHDGSTPTNNQPVVTSTYIRYVKANGGLNVRNNPNGTRIGGLASGTKVTVSTTVGNWSHIVAPLNGWVCSDYLYSTQNNAGINNKVERYTIGKYRVNASVLNVRYGAGTNYKAKTWRQLTANARSQNSRFGNYYTNGYKKGVVCTVTKVSGLWGYTASGWISLAYCTKI